MSKSFVAIVFVCCVLAACGGSSDPAGVASGEGEGPTSIDDIEYASPIADFLGIDVSASEDDQEKWAEVDARGATAHRPVHDRSGFRIHPGRQLVIRRLREQHRGDPVLQRRVGRKVRVRHRRPNDSRNQASVIWSAMTIRTSVDPTRVMSTRIRPMSSRCRRPSSRPTTRRSTAFNPSSDPRVPTRTSSSSRQVVTTRPTTRLRALWPATTARPSTARFKTTSMRFGSGSRRTQGSSSSTTRWRSA